MWCSSGPVRWSGSVFPLRLGSQQRSCCLRCEDGASDHFWDLRDYGVPEGFKSVQLIGKPINHSENCGLISPNSPRSANFSSKLPRERPTNPIVDFGTLLALGVGQDPYTVAGVGGTNG